MALILISKCAIYSGDFIFTGKTFGAYIGR